MAPSWIGRVSFKDEVERSEVVESVEALLDGLRNRRIHVRDERGSVAIRPDPELEPAP